MQDDRRERDTPEIDVERLLQKVRQELAAQGLAPQTAPYQNGGGVAHGPASLGELSASISAAEDRADILSHPPALARYRGLIRKLAAFAVKVVTRLSRFLLDQQIGFNRAATQGMRHMSHAVEDLDRKVEDLDRKAEDLDRKAEDLDRKAEDLDRKAEALRNEQDSTLSQLSYLKSTIHLQDTRIDALLAGTRGEGDDSVRAAQFVDAGKENAHTLDALYATFQDRFRGSREDIKMRLRAHLPRVMGSAVGTDAMPIIDLGCGRGEWLELLRDEGLRARGVDLNRVSIAACREIGLEVVEQDALSYLRGLSQMDVGAVTGFHIIEHLPLEVLVRLLDETYRVLKSGGIAIFETPNPQNVVVGSCNFYLDPTHRNPLPAGLAQFMMEIRGFSKVEIVPLHPYPEESRIRGSELADRFSDYFYGPQDYAVVGYKP